jgi:hypothetical protein
MQFARRLQIGKSEDEEVEEENYKKNIASFSFDLFQFLFCAGIIECE